MLSGKVSVIIPVYNGEKYIGKCIESILNQTYREFEIIVVNDGSTDNSANEVKKIEDKRVKIYNKDNTGVSDTRNYGLSKAKGEYVIFIDADDTIDHSLLETMVKTIKEKDVDIIRYNGYIQSKDGEYHGIEFPVKNNTILSADSDKESIIDIINSPSRSIRCYSPFLFMKNTNIISFNTDLTYLEDKVFYLENMLNDKRTLFLNEKLYYYNYNEQSKTKDITKFVKNIDDIIYSQERIKLLLDNKHDVLADSSTISLIIYRMQYFATVEKYSNFKKIAKQIVKKEYVKALLKNKKNGISKYVSLQCIFLKLRLFILFYAICLFKRIIKKGEN